MSHSTSLLLYAVLAIGGLIVLIARFKVNAFIALILASFFVGLCAGMNWLAIVKSFQDGLGATLGSVAVIVGLGAMLGKLLAESGGAEVVANRFARLVGPRHLPWAVLLMALVIGIPTWFVVGLILLLPIVFALVRETGQPLLRLGLPLMAGLSVMHGLVPPHPGPVAAMEALKADPGRTILWSFIVGVPTAVLAGPMLARFLVSRVPVELVSSVAMPATRPASLTPPGLGVTLFTILLPVLLMLMATFADVTLPKDAKARAWLGFIGSPSVAMLAAVLMALWTFGAARGFHRKQLLKFTEDSLMPVGLILLVVGAGGGFNRVLRDSGAAQAIGDVAQQASLSPITLGWLVAAVLRVATGSATVAINAAAGVVAPLAGPGSGVNVELLVVAMGAGSLILSHLNDGGFWFVKEYFGLTVPQTLKTWTVLETIVAVTALVLVWLLDAMLR